MPKKKPAKKKRPERNPCLPGWWLRFPLGPGGMAMLLGPGTFSQMEEARKYMLQGVADAKPVGFADIQKGR